MRIALPQTSAVLSASFAALCGKIFLFHKVAQRNFKANCVNFSKTNYNKDGNTQKKLTIASIEIEIGFGIEIEFSIGYSIPDSDSDADPYTEKKYTKGWIEIEAIAL